MQVRANWGGRAGNMRGLCGGEPLPAALRDEVLPLVNQLWNVYGPTETTVWSTVACLSKAGEPQFPGTKKVDKLVPPLFCSTRNG